MKKLLVVALSAFSIEAVFACPELSGTYKCINQQTDEVYTETISMDLSAKTITFETPNETKEKYLLDAGKKVTDPLILSESFDIDTGKITISSTHYDAKCVNNSSLKIDIFLLQTELDKENNIVAQEATVVSGTIDRLNETKYSKSYEGKILSVDFVSTEICTKI